MATPQLSPGVLIREVDLTVGRSDNVIDNIGAIAGPFPTGPVEEVVNITTEQELINVFGKPISNNSQYEYWMSASSFLSYGGVLKVVRVDDDNLVNANAIRNSSGVSTAGEPALKIKNFDDYELNYADDIANYIFAAKTPGSWSNDLKVCVIDDKADQILQVTSAVSTASSVGYGVTVSLTNQPVAGIGTTTLFTGYLKGIITGVGSSTLDVKITSLVSTGSTADIAIDYQQRNDVRSIRPGKVISVINSSGTATTTYTLGAGEEVVKDWYDEQYLELTNTRILWSSIAPKPTTTQFALDRNSKNDAIHIAVVDDSGSVTGVQGNLLEKHLFLSKAEDSISAVNPSQKNWWKAYLAQFSSYVYAGDDPSDNAKVDEPVYQTGFSAGFSPYTNSQGQWNNPVQNVVFSALGNVTYTLTGGKNYNVTNSYQATLGGLVKAYRLFGNRDEVALDYLIMGPGLGDKYESQAKAQEIISLANSRKDCIAVISPHRGDVVDITNTENQTDNVISFYSALSSSSYAVFDNGYKYTYDRFNNKFRYIPCNADIAGLMVRTGIDAYPWFSPAGQQRGVLNNAIKLAYNPNKAQRDRLYPLRINSVVNQPGIGVILFGDKTALGYASAFDRINVRRLFLTVEQALERTAQAQLFEINDQITRANFINIVEPYLRDVQAKRGIYDFRVICDETNNTPSVIDNNEFRADIFLKPTKAINYVTLTFVATRTGVSFEEVTGRV
ncbi:tail sheath monomer [Synechococcus phage B3]|nr:tail sheath monomer [Synechococcus phage B3]QGT54882.1 tail sheath monomer [Synechococcus phage B23]